MIHRYIPKAKRKARSRLMHTAKQAKRELLGVDADTLRWRAMRDAQDLALAAKTTLTTSQQPFTDHRVPEGAGAENRRG